MSSSAVLADIHGNMLALQAVVDDLTRRGITSVVNLGDHASGPLWPHETLTLLMQQSWVQIAGNHDRQLVRQPPERHGAVWPFSRGARAGYARLAGAADHVTRVSVSATQGSNTSRPAVAPSIAALS